MVGMNILAIIPARGGSKGVPGKNIRSLAGKPLIAWTIEEAKKSTHALRTIVSTDDPGIADVARACGADVPFMRPAQISGDLSTDVEFIEHALGVMKETEGYVPDILLRLPPTSPLRTHEDIDKGVATLLADPEADAARPIMEALKHPYKMWKIGDSQKYLESFLPREFTGFDEPHNLPRQRFPLVYIHTGAMDVVRRSTIETQHSTSGKRLAYFFMPPERSVNIDHPIDFEIAEFLMKKRLGMV